MPRPVAQIAWGAVAALALYCALVGRFEWLCDDAFISFRYAKNWAHGLGLRFNPGPQPPVEGYSNFLWVALGTLVELAGGRQTAWMPVFSAVAGAGLLVALAVASRRGLGLGPAAITLALLTLAASVPFAVWATGGLETMLFAALFFLVFHLFVLEPTGVPVLWAGLASFALALVRIEGTFWAVGLGALAWISRRARGDREGWEIVGAMAIAAAGAWAWWIARYLYYDDPWPNTVYAKVGFSAETLGLGLRYAATFLLTWITPLFCFAAVPAVMEPPYRTRALPALACVAAIWAYAIAVGGDFMAMGRLIVPALAFQALAVGVLFERLARSVKPGVRVLAPVLALVHVTVGLAGGLGIDPIPDGLRPHLHFRGNAEEVRTELEQWRYMRENTRERTILAQLLAETTNPGESLVRGAIGVVGFYTDLYVYDTFGLVSPEVSHREEIGDDHSPGHWKRVETEFFLDRDPTYVVARSFPIPADRDGRADLAQRVRRLARKWREPPVGERYAPIATRHRDPLGSELEQLLVRVRLVEYGDLEGPWARFEAVLSDL